MLFKKIADVIIGEVRILRFLIAKLYSEDLINVHPIFPAKKYSAASWDKELVNAIDKGADKIISEGVFRQLPDQVRPYYRVLENQ